MLSPFLFLLQLLLLIALAALVEGFVSRPDIEATTWNVSYTAPNANISKGSIFIAQRVLTPNSIAIYSQDGDIIYFDQPSNVVNASNGAFNWRPQVWNGDTVLTYWEGATTVNGWGYGRAIVLGNNYTVLANVSATNGSDFHEVSRRGGGPDFIVVWDRGLLTGGILPFTSPGLLAIPAF